MLVLTRKPNESVEIFPDYSKVTPSTSVGELFGDSGSIIITAKSINGKNIKLMIDAPEEFAIVRSEVEERYTNKN